MRGRHALLLLMLAATITGQGPAPGGASMPATPVVATMPTFKVVNGPGAMFPALHPIPPEEDLARFKYVTKEYFVSGIAQGQPYMTRLVVRRPSDTRKFSGIVVAEPMHPTGNDWMFYFLRTYLMSEGHIAVEIATSSLNLLTQFKTADLTRGSTG